MKTLDITFRTLLIVLATSIFSTYTYAQQGWTENHIYQVRGGSETQTNIQTEWNPWIGYYENIMYCRTLNWHQQYYSGQVYHWEWNSYYRTYRWQSQWREGFFWQCNWSGWARCV